MKRSSLRVCLKGCLSGCWLGLAWFLSGCGTLGLEGDVEVRARNGSSVVIDEATLFLPRVSLVFSDLKPAEATPYTEVRKAYRKPSAQVVVGQDTSRIQVIDYVGEKPLEAGRHTYILSFFEGNPQRLRLDFERD
jgi:hypothetical protein